MDGTPSTDHASRRFVRQDMAVAEMVPLEVGSAAVLSRRSPARDGDNEDAAAVFAAGNGRAVLAVADGLGGQPAGAHAAEVAITSLGTCVSANGDGLRGAILNGFEQANATLAGQGVGAATTLSVIEIEGRSIRSYHAGDSVILVVGQRGRIKLRTVSHSPVGYAVESGYMAEAEAIRHEDLHLVSNMVGSAQMHIEVGPTLELGRRDTVVLASDGLADNLLVDEIAAIVRAGPLDEAAAGLAAAASRRMGEPGPGHPSKPDDLTFVLYRPGG